MGLNYFKVTGFVSEEPVITDMQTASVARFPLYIKENRRSGKIRVEAWRKKGNEHFFDLIKKGNMLTLEGELQPDMWTDKETNEIKNKIVLNAIKINTYNEEEDNGIPE